VPSRRDRTRPARASTCRCCDVLATVCEISAAISSTDRSPCASTSTISARRPLPSACATDANPSNSAAFASPPATVHQVIKRMLDNLGLGFPQPRRRGNACLRPPATRDDLPPEDAHRLQRPCLRHRALLQRTPTRASLVFDGITVTAAKDGVWQIEADGKVASARFLDEAIEQVLPSLRSSERDRLLIQLLYLANQPNDAKASCGRAVL